MTRNLPSQQIHNDINATFMSVGESDYAKAMKRKGLLRQSTEYGTLPSNAFNYKSWFGHGVARGSSPTVVQGIARGRQGQLKQNWTNIEKIFWKIWSTIILTNILTNLVNNYFDKDVIFMNICQRWGQLKFWQIWGFTIGQKQNLAMMWFFQLTSNKCLKIRWFSKIESLSNGSDGQLKHWPILVQICQSKIATVWQVCENASRYFSKCEQCKILLLWFVLNMRMKSDEEHC